MISKHFTATPRIPPTYAALKVPSINCNFTVEPQTFTTDLSIRLRKTENGYKPDAGVLAQIKIIGKLEKGQILEGTVKNITTYGAASPHCGP